MKIIGHKGAAGYMPENSLSAFKKAIELGCHRAELDVRLTMDNQLVVFHDKEVDNLTNGKGFINEMTLKEVQELILLETEKIPTLQEVIDVCKGKIDIQIELKAEGTPKLVYDMIKKNDLLNNVCITSFKPQLLQEIKTIDPVIKVGLLFWTEDIIQNLWNFVQTIPLDFIGPGSDAVTSDMVIKAHELHKIVYAYMVHNKETYNKMHDLGVDEIGTDYPALFLEV